ncbi:FadR/GntR family transcriptional regulator [Rhodococcus aetherivorans]
MAARSKAHAVDSFAPQPVKRPRKQVEDQLAKAILSGQFAHGEKLPPESQLANLFEVSRPTVHQALEGLSKRGLIRRVPGTSGGSFVNSVTQEGLSNLLSESLSTTLRLGTLEIAELTEVRELLEIPAAALAAKHREDYHLDILRTIVDKQRKASTSDPSVPALDHQFHSTIAQASGNRFLAALVRSVHSTSQPVSFLDLSEDVGRATVKQHVAILRAIEAGDFEAASQEMATHLEFVKEHSSTGEAIS